MAATLVAAVGAAAFSSPGRAVLRSLQHAVRGEQNATPALFSLPAPGRLLVDSERGVWVVQADGSKRLLRAYRDASWSPHGLYLAAVSVNELRALEPDGAVHWSVARPGRLALPRWSDATPPCCRIAYLAGQTLRVVNGDGTGDRLLATGVAPVAAAWRPRTHVLAYVDRRGLVQLVEADPGRPLCTLHRAGRPEVLGWSPDGRALLVRGAHTIELFGPGQRQLEPLGPGPAKVTDATLSPDGHTVAFAEHAGTSTGARSFLARVRSARTRRRACGPRFRGRRTLRGRRVVTGRPLAAPELAERRPMAIHPLDGRQEDPGRVEHPLEFRAERAVRGLVLQLTPCYGAARSRRKEADQMTIALASARRASRL